MKQINFMNQSKTINFQGQEYFDDRLFILYLCKGKVEIESDGVAVTSIYHENAPDDHIWCVATYRNCNRYPLYRVDNFYKKKDAEAYIKEIEPQTPLISLGGAIPKHLLSYADYITWKKKNDLKDYDWQSLYAPGGTNATERIYQKKEQFQEIK